MNLTNLGSSPSRTGIARFALGLLLLIVCGFTNCEHNLRFIVIESPDDGTTFTEAQTVTLVASASIGGAAARIVEMRFYHNDDDKPAGVDLDGPPYTHAWTISGQTKGAHTWRAEALFALSNANTETLVSDQFVYQVSISRSLPPPSPGIEARCAELGENCVCSETLDTASWELTSDNGGQKGWVHPTGPVSSKPCGVGIDGGTAEHPATWYGPYNPPEFSIVPATRMPAGNTVSNVWREFSAAGTNYLNGSTPIKETTQRLCHRFYTKFNADYQHRGEGSCDGHKISQQAGGLLCGDGGSADSWNFVTLSHSEFPETANLPRSGKITWNDCTEEWCRFEFCVSGNITQGTNLSAEGYIERVTGGRKRMEWPLTYLGNATSSAGVPGAGLFWIANFFDPGCTGGREISHAMQAEWPRDEGQFVGSACEVEGADCRPL